MRRHREGRNLTQEAFAGELNARFGRKYDRAKISKWESGAERVPKVIQGFLTDAGAVPQENASHTEMAAPVAGETKKDAAPKPPPALVVSAANRKGGCAKTTTCVALATILARKYRVLLIDLDSQGNATYHLGVDRKQRTIEKATIREVLGEDKAILDVMLKHEPTGIHLVPASMTLSKAEKELAGEAGARGYFHLRKALMSVRESFDFVIIDTPPNLGMLTANALVASDSILIACQTEPFSIEAVAELLEVCADMRENSTTNAEFLGILPTMFDGRLTQDRASLDEIHEQYQELRVFDPVPSATIYPQAVAAGRSTLEVAPNAAGAEQYQAVAEALIEERLKRFAVKEAGHGH